MNIFIRSMNDYSFSQLLIIAERIDRNDNVVTFYDKNDKFIDVHTAKSINAAKRLVREFNHARR